MQRTRVTEAELIGKIREGLADTDCADCVPTALGPIHPVAGSVNWQVLDNPPCSDPCQAKMLEICSALAGRYDVDWPTERRGVAR